MASSIVGTLPIQHSVDTNGSLTISVPLHAPPAKMAPDLSLSYHSASTTTSVVGTGWALKGVSLIERVAPTIVQDGFRGAVNYDQNDRFALNGQRLVSIGNNQFRYEIEQWSKIVTTGSDPANPESWTEYLPNGTKRYFGNTANSNIKAVGKNATRVWAISESVDPFQNYVSYTYNSDSVTGAFNITEVNYGGNQALAMQHQRQLSFQYEARPDVRVTYLGGSMITTDQRLISVAATVQGKLVRKHIVNYDLGPLTGGSRVKEVTIADPTGATVRPLKFDWHDANESIFEAALPPVTINPQDNTAFILPMDVNASGKSDLVVVSKRFSNGVQTIHLDVHEADSNGVVSQTPSTTFDGDLDYNAKLLPLDFNGDGRNDILHIASSAVKSNYTLTVILSTPNGYVAQSPMTFESDFARGSFYTGDFQGTGNIGLLHVSQTFNAGSPQLRFTQFVSDGKTFTALAPIDGPSGVSAAGAQIIVADMNGDVAEDVFIISEQFKNGSSVCHIDFLESQQGVLAYQPTTAFASVAESIIWKPTNVFLPYTADEDGKTSLLVATESSGNLQLQVLRCTGPSLVLTTPPITTQIPYNGNITLAHTTSTSAVDLLNTFNKTVGQQETQLTVLRFYNNTFVEVANVTQPGTLSSFVTYADLRGVGRTDCVLNTHDPTTGKLTISSMKCSASLQPVDFLSGYENGLGAKLSVAYAPLSDPSIYTADGPDSPLPSLNAFSRNVSAGASLSPSQRSSTATRVSTRSQIAHFPSFVVKTMKHTPYAMRPDVVDRHEYTYQNARYGFEGRGWLGFEKLTKTAMVEGCATTTQYRQDFPFVGQAAQVEKVDVSGSTPVTLQVTENTWQCTDGPGNNRFLHLDNVKESHYEQGTSTFDVTASYQHDNFGNITNNREHSAQRLALIDRH
ncbi:hypothetical protein HGRIS_010250 [Hohenbuehelia grisea]|uniref:Insecticide toxin TcdB middle/N-terminal domain-containing protein n=1 Tax=Hohenbuehelia grisea TaxID=104357 RepID=A0ABR3J3Q6_9AGAR